MTDFPLESYWPVKAIREAGTYFYLEAIAEYLPGNRVRVVGRDEPLLLLGGYSYLGLNGHPHVNRAACEAVLRYGTGTHGVRLLAGSLQLHRELEAKLAAFAGTEAAAVFTSGYVANTSTLSAVVGRHDTLICDKLDHASIVDGCRLSGAAVERFRHNDLNHLEELLKAADTRHKRLVVIDAVYSMDGDIADLPGILALCRRYGAWLMVDEAHSVGVIGATGRGIEEHFGLPPGSIDIKMGTLSKAIPSCGGYIAGSRRLIDFLQHQARGFIYSASVPPASAAAALAAVEVLEREPERVRRLHENVAFFARRLREEGFDFLNSRTAIFPIVCEEDEKSREVARGCWRRGVYVQGIPHPVVPKGTARLRAAVSATHTREDLEVCVRAVRAAAEEAEIGGRGREAGR